jgi:hypothetical protein
MDSELEALFRRIAQDPSDFMAWVAYLSALIRLRQWNLAEDVLAEMLQRFGMSRLPEIQRLVPETQGAVIVEYGAVVAGAAIEVILLFGAGLALPASKMGKLTLDDDADREKWYQLIVALYRRHVTERNAYREGDRTRTITQLWADADYLLRLVEAYLRRYPDDDLARVLRMIERAARGWIDQYWRQEDEWYRPAPPQSAPLPSPPAPAPAPAEHPHTVERPTSYEDWLKEQKKGEAQRKRERIARIRQRIRELMRKRRNPDYNYDSIHEIIDGYIEALMKELQKLRDELTAAGEETGEEFDEPIEPLPPAPIEPWPLGHPTRPYRLYVNPKTGEQRWFLDPPDSDSDWQPASDYHWGWVPEVDPNTGRIIWKPGWVPGPEPTGSSRSARSLQGRPALFTLPEKAGP